MPQLPSVIVVCQWQHWFGGNMEGGFCCLGSGLYYWCITPNVYGPWCRPPVNTKCGSTWQKFILLHSFLLGHQMPGRMQTELIWLENVLKPKVFFHVKQFLTNFLDSLYKQQKTLRKEKSFAVAHFWWDTFGCKIGLGKLVTNIFPWDTFRGLLAYSGCIVWYCQRLQQHRHRTLAQNQIRADNICIAV